MLQLMVAGALRQRLILVVVALVMVGFGVNAARHLSVDAFPDVANVQVQNVKLFERMSWTSLEEFELYGVVHHRMRADLAAYPPFAQAETGFRSLARKAA